jgi:hypothetical protein
MASGKTPSKIDFNSFLAALNDIPSEVDLEKYYSEIAFQGFNRSDVLKRAHELLPVESVIKIAIVGGLRGSNLSKIGDLKINSDGTSINDLVKRGTLKAKKAALKKSNDLTVLRITACLPHIVAYFLYTVDSPPRTQSTCPAWLQFPNAASIKMNPELLTLHKEFSQQFSVLIGGTFNENIYKSMVNSAIPLPDTTIGNDLKAAEPRLTKEND